MDAQTAITGLDQLNNQDKAELQQFIVNESARSRLQQSIHSTTDMCFRKCITSKITGGQLDRYEEPCLKNCVERFMDSHKVVLGHLEKMKDVQ